MPPKMLSDSDKMGTMMLYLDGQEIGPCAELAEDLPENQIAESEAAEMLQDIFDNSYIHALFMAVKGSKPEDVRMVTEMLNRFKETNPNG